MLLILNHKTFLRKIYTKQVIFHQKHHYSLSFQHFLRSISVSSICFSIDSWRVRKAVPYCLSFSTASISFANSASSICSGMFLVATLISIL